MTRFAAWLESVTPPGARPVFVAFNAPFDWMFVNDYFHRFLGQNPFGHNALDMKAYYMGQSGGRWADAIAMRSVDLAMTLPPVIFLLVLASIVGSGIWSTVFVIALLSWPVLSRMIRARLLELRERDFVMASRGMGAGLGHLLFRHGLPNSIDILVVYATLQVANAILLEAGLSFLGLGVPPPAASWGNMLNAARSTAVLEQFPWQWLFPGAALVLAVLAINFIGDGLRDAFDPRAEL